MSKQEIKYSDNQIEDNAKHYGYKAANLIKLQNIIQEFNQSKEAEELRRLYGKIRST
ncbi:MAG: hypothetical protein RCG15_03570 [Candidatus Rickettsia vulgarisii]